MPGISQTSNSVMTALVTDDEEKFTKLASQYSLKAYKYADFDKLLEEDVCDAIYLATPNWMHRKFAVPALEKGYHVLLEKPMEVSEEDCQAIIEAQKKSGAKLMIAYRLHFEPGNLTVIDRVRKGDFGDPRIFSSVFTMSLDAENHRAKHGFDAGPVPDIGTYCINACRNLFGSEPIEVSARGTKTPGRESLEMEHDTVSATLIFPGDRVAQFTVGYSTLSTEGFKLVGTKGEITLNPSYHWTPGTKMAYTALIEGKEETKTFNETDHFAGETEYFSECIINNVLPEPNGEEGLMDVRVIYAIKKSLETHQPVKLELVQRSSKGPTLDQIRELKQSSKPSEFIGRDAQPPQ